MDHDDAARQSAALILGAAVWAGGVPSPTLLRRTRHAIALYKSGCVQCIVASGGLGKHAPSEAQVMQRICLDEGVPESHILLEEHATNTLENIRFSKNSAPNMSFVIVSDVYHAPRAWLTARAVGLSARVSCPKLDGTKPLRVVKNWLRECIALPVYALRLAIMRISGRL